MFALVLVVPVLAGVGGWGGESGTTKLLVVVEEVKSTEQGTRERIQ